MCFISENTVPDEWERHFLGVWVSPPEDAHQEDEWMYAMENEMSVRDLVQQSDCYKLFAACFYEPDIELFLGEQVCVNLANVLSNIAPKAESSARYMQIAIEEMDAEELLADYARLFVGPFELLAPPYGSVYLEKSKQVMGDSTMAVLEKYRKVGLEINIKEPPDHIAFELEFLHYLSVLEIQACGNCEQDKGRNLAATRKDFLENDLIPWIPVFCQKIKIGVDNRFYSNLADCLEEALKRFAASHAQFSLQCSTVENEKDAERASLITS